LLFASLDPEAAAARGVPVRLIAVGFLLLLAVAVAEVSQITGALLVFALLVMPAAAAQRLTARPWLSVIWAIILGLAATWLSLAVAFYTPYPVGFYVTSFGFGFYLLASLYGLLLERRQRTPSVSLGSGGGVVSEDPS
jgi:zinc/manganese transport system permease protein